MTDKRAYFKLDVGYLTNPKVSALLDDQPRAILLHLQCIAYSAQHLTDGLVPMRLAMRLACAEQCDLDLLVQCGLVERVDDAHVMVHDYLEHQRPASEVKRASEQGKRAAEARWASADGNAQSMPAALPNPMPREREERDTSTAPTSSTPRRGTRIPDNFTLTDDMRQWAHEKGYDRLDLDTITEEFCDYWSSLPGAKATKLDWVKTWKNRVRDTATKPGNVRALRHDDDPYRNLQRFN